MPIRRIGAPLFALGVIGSVLALGATDTPVLIAVALVLFCAFVAEWWGGRPVAPRPRASTILAVFAGLTVVTFLQLIPMPASLVAVVSPRCADVWARSVHPFGEAQPAWMSISLDPTATRIQALRGVCYAMAFLTSLRLARHRRGTRSIERVLVGGGVLLALVTLVHWLFDARKVYGLFPPKTDVTLVAPLMNQNHLAAYLNVAILLALASFLADRPTVPRPVAAGSLLLLLGTSLRLASRGAICALLVGMVLLVMFSSRPRRDVVLRWGMPLGLAVAAIAFVLVTTSPHVGAQLTDTDVSKLTVPAEVIVKMVPKFFLLGVGRGAFESTYPAFRTGAGFLVWTNPENIVAQWAAEWGAPVAGVALIASVRAFLPSSAISTSWRPIGTWVALVAVVLQNLVDYSLEIPAVAIAVAVCAGHVCSGGESQLAKTAPWWSADWRRTSVAVGVALALALILVLTRGSELTDERDELRAEIMAHPEDAAATARLRRAVADHPAEPYFMYLGARLALGHKTSVIPWVNATLERAPVYPPVHLLLARSLRNASPSQARVEYRLYAEQNGGYSIAVLELVPVVDDYEDAIELALPGKDGVGTLDGISELVIARLPATRARIDAEILRRDPVNPAASLRVASDALADVEAPASWCADPSDCLAEANRASNAAVAAAPTRCEAHVIAARVMIASGRIDPALEELRSATDLVAERVDCLCALGELAVSTGRRTVLADTTQALSRATCGSTAGCGLGLLRAAELELRAGNRMSALVFLRRATAASPDDDDASLRLAKLASEAGLHGEAADTYDRLAVRNPGNPQYGVAARAERSQIGLAPPATQP